MPLGFDQAKAQLATVGLFLLHRLGYDNLALYDASMAERARDESLPIPRGGGGAQRGAVALATKFAHVSLVAGLGRAPMERSISMPLGVVVERREIDNRWQRWSWKPVAVIPGAPPVEAWRELVRGDRFVHWHAATLPLKLHRTETEGYRVNLSGRAPAIYVVLRKIQPSERTAGNDVGPFLVTASPYEAEGYLEGEDVVEVVPMSEGLIAWVQAFIERHHVDQPFVKRKRAKAEDGGAEGQVDGFVAPRVRQRGSHG